MHCLGFAYASSYQHFCPKLAFWTILWTDPGLTPWWSIIIQYFIIFTPPGQIFSQQIKSQWNSPAQQLSKLWQNTHLFKVKTTECSSDILQTAECFLLPFLWKSIRVKRSWQLGTHIQNHSFLVQETIRLPCLTPASQMTEFRDQVISPRV